MIVGTAGHIDHGKSTLVKALTGVDTDRLPEERARGISIELGYAFLDVPGARIGFVDVPGHERLVHTMLAGATGIDHALLLVAADDGVMPQTVEHLAVLSLLGLSRGAIVITKIDRVDGARLAQVREQVDALRQGSSLHEAPLLAVSALSGEGLDALRAHLAAAALDQPRRARADDGFRLAVDRAFSLSGAGTVVTGTVHAGEVSVGDELVLVPGDATRRHRVRSLHAQNRAADRARAGERCALALVGLDKETVQRGQWLCAPAVVSVTDRFDAHLALWHGETKGLRSGTTVHVHLGAADRLGSLAVLDEGDVLAPGAQARVQVVLREPIGAWWGDRVVLRDASATRTLAGGRVLDPQAPARHRRTPQRLAALAIADEADRARRLHRWVEAAPLGVDLPRWSAGQGIVVQALPALDETVLRAREGGADWALGATAGEAIVARTVEVLTRFHEQEPDELGPDLGRLRRLVAPRLDERLWRALIERQRAGGQVAVSGGVVHLPGHALTLSATELRIAQKLGPRLAAAGYEGAWVRDLARDGGESEPLVRVTLSRMARRSELHQVVKDLYYPVSTMQRLAAIARAIGEAGDGDVRAAGFRDHTGLGRKRAIQILEYFDRIGVLRRIGDNHRVRTDCELFRSP